ncbi:MAG TPA: CoA ester lyase [Steroidobacteraceae bacterium]|nr:CoA ester lyase [Steroidobacteraceae bacterium]
MSEADRSARPRSWLFVPGDSERKQAKALSTAADALIFDLEDSVALAQLPAARARVAELIGTRAETGAQLWVRVNAPSSDLLHDDLDAVCAAAMPAGIVLPKVSSARELVTVAHRLAILETRLGQRPLSTRLLVIATETAQALLGLPQYPALLEPSPDTRARLIGLTWGAEDLSTALGSLGRYQADGSLTFTLQMARSLCLVTAAAIGVAAIDGVHADFRDAAGLARELQEARRDGFTGKLAIHPEQIAPINAAFTPTESELEHARRVVEAFAAAAGSGVASLDGRMIDRPHLVQAQRLLAAARGGS